MLPYMEDGINGKPKLEKYGGKGIREKRLLLIINL
jgi:hypothetical protein